MRLRESLRALGRSPAFARLRALVENRKGPIEATNLHGSSKAVVAAAVGACLGRPLVILTSTTERGERWGGDLRALLGEENVCYLPPWGPHRYEEDLPHKELLGERIATLTGLLQGKARATVIPALALLQPVSAPEIWQRLLLRMKVGDRLDLEAAVRSLLALGYEREEAVSEVGNFSLRGGILDVYAFMMEEPVRIEWAGDEIASLREFDLVTQRSTRPVSEARLLPAREPPLGGGEAGVPVLRLFPREAILIWDERPEVEAEMERAHSHLLEVAAEEEREPGPIVPPGAVISLGRSFQEVALSSLHFHAPAAPGAPEAVRFQTREPEPVQRNMARLRQGVRRLQAEGTEVIILCDNEGQRDRLAELLEEERLLVHLEVGALEAGFLMPEGRLAVLTDHEIFQRPRKLRYRRRYRGAGPLESFTALQPGDHVVHIQYGIARYQGLQRLRLEQGEIECLELVYEGGDRVYVPVDQLALVEKYSSQDGAPPRLDRLGSPRWARVRERTRQGIEEMARELLASYARRQVVPGFAFSLDTQWQRALESSFIYEDTPDQRATAEEVKRDMERPRPMDRLVCGDVGYGKTEVAIRAAFKAVQDGKQVAVLVPTTLLAQQHRMTFAERIADYPVRIEMLSRFLSPRQQREVVRHLAEGTTDIVIGTHRLLSPDVAFRDLGLVIIDEEHRFGVRHKEALKALCAAVDVLHLSATPIPRTFHLSLMGLRDMSLIDTPPRDRVPIVTYVVEFNEEMIAEAILREVDRGGQVFFVHNRVESIGTVTRYLRRLLPSLTFAMAHGQMEERELEAVMWDFLASRIDVLVTTLIIESGLDVPNANTLIVNRADRFGLAQLYQLRGRVGRSYRRAYAYLLTPPRKQLDPEATKRLRVLEEYTELGSGYRVALRDLELRGAGNILGTEQHGFISAVGFDTYLRLLEESVRQLRGQKVARRPEVALAVDLPALLPDDYVPSMSQKLALYRRLSGARSLGEVAAVEEELLDRYGPLPEEAHALLRLIEVKGLAGEHGIRSVTLTGDTVTLAFHPGHPERLVAWDRALRRGRLRGEMRRGRTVTLAVTGPTGAALLAEVRDFLRGLTEDAKLPRHAG